MASPEVSAEGPDPEEPENVGGLRSPLRRCIVTGAVDSRDTLIRFVAAPDGHVVPDLAASLPGRGYWVQARRDILETAIRKNLFSRAARKPVRAGSDLPALVETLLRQRCLDLLGLARRAGQMVFGFDNVDAALRSGRAEVILTASDAGADGRNKIQGLAAGKTVTESFDSSALGSVCGRDRIIHVALFQGALARNFLAEVKRYTGILPDTHEPSVPSSGPAQQ
ncbi:MAG: RNA-binding protein [Pseudomonadota bacterium]|nr:RNA-binding protein [Pseudomonadota bacterium]